MEKELWKRFNECMSYRKIDYEEWEKFKKYKKVRLPEGAEYISWEEWKNWNRNLSVNRRR